jgi:hypothetical protein
VTRTDQRQVINEHQALFYGHSIERFLKCQFVKSIYLQSHMITGLE